MTPSPSAVSCATSSKSFSASCWLSAAVGSSMISALAS